MWGKKESNFADEKRGPKMKIAICFVVLIAAAAKATLEDDFYKLEKSVQDKLVSKVTKAYESMKNLTDNLKAMEKAFPSDFQKIETKLKTFISNVEDLAKDAKALYEDKKKGKSFALALKVAETGYKFTEVESEFRSMRPLFSTMIQDRLTGAKSAWAELTTFLGSIVSNGFTGDLHKISDLLSDESASTILKKIGNAYTELRSGFEKVKTLAKQYPEVYHTLKDDIPDFEKTLKSLYEDYKVISADKKKGETIEMMIKVGEASVKLTHLISIVEKVKPEIKDLLSETKGSVKSVVEEVDELLQMIP